MTEHLDKFVKKRLYFEGFNQHGEPCPICKTHADRKTVLIPIMQTNEGLTYEAIQVHLECLLDVLMITPDKKFIGAKFE